MQAISGLTFKKKSIEFFSFLNYLMNILEFEFSIKFTSYRKSIS